MDFLKGYDFEIPIIKGRDWVNCKKGDVCKKAAQKGFSPKAIVCSKCHLRWKNGKQVCKYLNQFETAKPGIYFATQAMLPYFKESFDTVVIDEESFGTMLYSIKVKYEKVLDSWPLLPSFEPVATKIIDYLNDQKELNKYAYIADLIGYASVTVAETEALRTEINTAYGQRKAESFSKYHNRLKKIWA